MGSSLVTVTISLVIVFGASVRFVDAGERGGGQQPAVYRKWPACKKGIEYVEIVKRSDRVEGETYYERQARNGHITKYYLCWPCTQCNHGVLVLAPCSVYSDTQCSPTECAVEGCILDDSLSFCRLPGDPNDFPSISAMMDPCDPATRVVPSTEAPVQPFQQPKEFKQDSLSKGDVKVANAPKKASADADEARDTQDVRWGPSEMTLVLTSIILVTVLANVVLISWVCLKFREEKVKRDASSTGESESSVAETTV